MGDIMKIIDEGVMKIHLDTINHNLKIGFALLEMNLETKGEEHTKALGMKTVLDDIIRQAMMAKLYLKE